MAYISAELLSSSHIPTERFAVHLQHRADSRAKQFPPYALPVSELLAMPALNILTALLTSQLVGSP